MFRNVTLLAGMLALAATGCSPIVLTVDDAVVMSGRETRFAAYLEREPILGAHDGFEDVTVRFVIDGREVARAETNGEGRASTLTELSTSEFSHFEAQATVGGRTVRTTGTFYTWRPDAVVIAVDIDGTIADTNFKELFLEEEDFDSDPIDGARRNLTGLAKDFHLFYLTARPRFVLDKTRRWLDRHGFPPAPVVTAHRVRDMIAQASYKRRTLVGLRERWPNVLIGIGNTDLDAEVYGASGMLTLIIDDSDEMRYRPHALVFSAWDAVGDFFTVNRGILAAADELKDAMANGRMVLKPIIPWVQEH